MKWIPCLVLLAAAFAPACRAPRVPNHGREVVTTVEVAAAPERVLRAFLKDSDLRGWWKVSCSRVTPRPGGTWAVTWDDYGEQRTSHIWTGVIQEVGARHLLVGNLIQIEPGRPLFAPMQLEVLTEPTASGCRLTVTQRGYAQGADWDWLHETVTRGWAHVLGDLQVWFATRQAERAGSGSQSRASTPVSRSSR